MKEKGLLKRLNPMPFHSSLPSHFTHQNQTKKNVRSSVSRYVDEETPQGNLATAGQLTSQPLDHYGYSHFGNSRSRALFSRPSLGTCSEILRHEFLFQLLKQTRFNGSNDQINKD